MPTNPPDRRPGRTGGTRPAFVIGLLVFLVFVVWAVWIGWRGGEDTPVVEPDPDPVPPTREVVLPPDDYVGSAACTPCHTEIAHEWSSHPMSRSMAVLPEDDPLEIYDAGTEFHPDGGMCGYRVELTDRGPLHHEFVKDADGEVIYDQAYLVRYAIGSGVRGRSYVIERDGILTQSPISWYTQAGRWDLSPGYSPDDPMRFDRRISDKCLSCHAGRVDFRRDRVDTYGDPAIIEPEIGCERCHGPGKRHVELQSSLTPPAAGEDDSIVNPGNLDPVRRESVCNQCHLSGAARLPRFGYADFDYRPGQVLGEVLTVLVEGTGISDGSTKSVSHVQQMRASRCFIESEGKLGCTSCHDPHSVPTDNVVEFYRDRCFTCHNDQSCSEPWEMRLERQPDDSCIACHMPRLNATDIAHTAQTDHRVLARPESDLEGEDSEGLTFLAEDLEHMEPWEVQRALAYALELTGNPTSDAAARLRMIRLMDEVRKAQPGDPTSAMVLGPTALADGQYHIAEDLYLQALNASPDHEGCWAGLVTVYYETGRFVEALQAVDRLIEINPHYAYPFSVKADILRRLGQLDQGIAAAERALELNPRLPQMREWLIESLRADGRFEAADEQQAILSRLRSAAAGTPEAG